MLSNLLRDFPAAALNAQEETFETLLARPDILIERIISTGQASPADFWYCQPQDEWVLVVQGSAGLQFADEAGVRELRAGDFVNIAAQRQHRVAWTAGGETTIWLAVHYGDLPPQATDAPATPTREK